MTQEEKRPSKEYLLALARELDVSCTFDVDGNTASLDDGRPMTFSAAYRTLIEIGQKQNERMATTEAQAGYHRGKADVLLGNEDDPREIGNYYYGVPPADLDKFVLGYRRAQREGR